MPSKTGCFSPDTVHLRNDYHFYTLDNTLNSFFIPLFMGYILFNFLCNLSKSFCVKESGSTLHTIHALRNSAVSIVSFGLFARYFATRFIHPSDVSVYRKLQNSGAEMMPFHNIFNEWYAAQTSKKIRAVWQMKAANGKRVSSTVPYGYMKSPDDKEKWIIDEEAAEVVRKIFSLALASRGISQIAVQLEREKVLVPTAYKIEKGLSSTHKYPEKPYYWEKSTVANILDNRQYTGCTVNFKTTTVIYKVHKVIHKPDDEQQIIPNTQEAIISEDL